MTFSNDASPSRHPLTSNWPTAHYRTEPGSNHTSKAMSRTSARSPLTFSSSDLVPIHSSTNQTDARPFHHQPAYINLSRTLTRYERILHIPSPFLEPIHDLTPHQQQLQHDLYSPLPFQRKKWDHNIRGAEEQFRQVEKQAKGIETKRAQQNISLDLAKKRKVVNRLKNKLRDIERTVEERKDEVERLQWPDDHRETAYDLLQRRSMRRQQERAGDEEVLQAGKPIQEVQEDPDAPVPHDEKDALFNTSSVIRRRGNQNSTSQPVAQTTGYSAMDPTERSMLDNSRTQEDLTASLISMAAQLKQQARNFQFSLSQDKGLLDRALEGLDKNLSGVQAASKNMQFLTRMSEGEGWFGRLKLYAIIFAMWLFAVFLVFFGPKLRF